MSIYEYDYERHMRQEGKKILRRDLQRASRRAYVLISVWRADRECQKSFCERSCKENFLYRSRCLRNA